MLSKQSRGADCLAFSRDEKYLAAGENPTIKLLDAQTGKEHLSLKGHTNTVSSLCFSPDGKRLASAAQDQTVKFWDTATGQETLSIALANSWSKFLLFSPDGRRLAAFARQAAIVANPPVDLVVWDAPPPRDLEEGGTKEPATRSAR